MFAFTSLGGTQDTSVNTGRGPYCYRLHGENKHRIGDLLPEEGKPPKFCQLYIYDTENEIRNRMQAVSNGPSTSSSNNELDYQLTTDIRDMLDSNNPLVSKFRMAGERIRSSDDPNLKLRLIGTRARDGRDHNLPTASEVAALIVGDFDSTKDKRDIILHRQNGNVKRISELHVLYLALQYPLFFPYAEDGYRTDVYHEGVTEYKEKNKGTRVTMREWFAYRLQDRRNQFSTILNGRRLLQQFIVDGYTMVEAERMSFVRKQQKDLRSETYSKLASLAQDPESGVTLRGKKVVLPSSFTGSPRYMMQNYLDAMTVCKFYGYPDLFITFTCNPNWPEIAREVSKKGLKPEDRPDVITRVFKIKLDSLIKEFKDERTFGRVRGVVYTIEFQKRGLPHCHILLWLEEEDKLTTPSHIDKYISAEIPDKEEDPELYQIVKDHMMHGPCGPENPSCPCTVDFKCTKKFPKQFNESTFIDESGYAIYRRRNDGNSIKKNGSDLHNGYVVPYNPGLLRRYQSHINVEWCNQIGSIKYLFKYINKGPDRVTVAVEGEEVDEVQDYYDCRYLSACEAAWRIYGFDIHYRTPSVERLPFHLENEQSVIFDATESIDYALDKSSVNETKFEAWMELNKTDTFAQTLLYVEIPKYYVWNQQDRIWQERQRGFSLGRIHHVPPSWGELFYLRILLNKVRGPMGWDDLKEYDDVVYPTYREACYARGLLEDDKEYIDGLLEARLWGMGDYLRSFFVMLLMTDSMSRPDVVWQKTWHVMAEDVLSVERKKNNNPGLDLSDTQRMNICLTYIEHMLLCNNKSLKSIPGIYATVMEAVDKDKGGMFFVYGYGGTGKTYLYKTMSVALRSQGEIVLNVASSGIAALLLEGGRTAHSRFAIPINVVEDSMCHIAVDSELADLIRKAKLIIWDEAPMINRHCYEAFDRTLKDICRSDRSIASKQVFGGKVVLFGGDFRQILPVIPNSSRQDVVHAKINSSYLWEHCIVLKLTVNLRLGSGATGGKNDGESTVEFLDNMLIPEFDDHVSSIIHETYPHLLQNLWNPEYFQERAILAPTHEMVDMINKRMLSLIPGDEKIYESSDSVSVVVVDADDTNFNLNLYTTDFLNTINVSGWIVSTKTGVLTWPIIRCCVKSKEQEMVEEALVHLLQLSKSPRIVNVSSGFGDLSFFNNEKLQEELHDIDKLTEQRIDEIIQWFLRDFKDAKSAKKDGLLHTAYKVSKATLNAYTRLMARKYCVTDMTYHTGFRSAEEGAKGPVMVALLPDDGPSGVYFNDKREIVPFWYM
ncbi:hypothetical protein Tco_0601963 [Tanacetum coccineum]